MLTNKESPHYLLRMGSHAERAYFEWAKSIYDALVLNANLVEGTPAACLSLIETLADKPYVIDPMNYAFALPVNYIQSIKVNKKTGEKTARTKRTFQGLADRYGKPFDIAVRGEARPLVPDDFANTAVRQNAVQRILEYEKERLIEEQPQSGPLRAATGDIQPTVLIIPYFYIHRTQTWRSTNINMINDAVDLGMALPTYAVLLLDKTILQDLSTLKEITKDYCGTKAEGFFVWVSDQREHSMGALEVKNFIECIKLLCSDGRPIYNMYGGYLSALISRFGLTGFCHGAGYGEHRSIMPVLGGSVPLAKYYFPPLHQTFMFTDAQTILTTTSTEEYYKTICNCPVCQNIIGNDFQGNFQKYGETEFKGYGKFGQEIYGQSANSMRICRGHYLAARFIEMQRVRKDTHSSLISQLREAGEKYQNSSGIPPTDYLYSWAEGISQC